MKLSKSIWFLKLYHNELGDSLNTNRKRHIEGCTQYDWKIGQHRRPSPSRFHCKGILANILELTITIVDHCVLEAVKHLHLNFIR